MPRSSKAQISTMKSQTLTALISLSTILTTTSFNPYNQHKPFALHVSSTPSTTIDCPTATFNPPKSFESSTPLTIAPLLESLNASFPTAPLHLTTIPSPEPSSTPLRGMITTAPIPIHSPLLIIPLSSCLLSDAPHPSWLKTPEHNNPSPSQWAIHLAAAVLQLQDDGLYPEWQSLLPPPDTLRASLPVHWNDEALSKSRSSALELSVDSAYFSRAEAVESLLASYAPHSADSGGAIVDQDELAERVHYALDVVQTRACRLDRTNNLLNPPLRVLAPLFDFLNHGGRSGANAAFGLEKYYDKGGDDDAGVHLVVRATMDLKEGEEVMLDYGESARPAWRCLANYGFLIGSEEEEDVAEVFMNGLRYEVGRDSIPANMVEVVNDLLRQENGQELAEEGSADGGLTPNVALRIAKRVSDVAFDLLMVDKGEQEMEDNNGEEAISERLAAKLRWSQHRVLMECAMGLRDYAQQNMNID